MLASRWYFSSPFNNVEVIVHRKQMQVFIQPERIKLFVHPLLLPHPIVAQSPSDYNSCVARNFSGGCTTGAVCTGAGSGLHCYCNQVCYSFGDCCPDIKCTPAITIPSSCVQANFFGCCDTWDCHGQGGSTSCYCDQDCYALGDCCNDVEDVGRYPPATAEPGSSEQIPGLLRHSFVLLRA